MVTTAWVLGSIQDMPARLFDIDAVEKTVAAGDYYLRDGTSGISLLSTLETQIKSEVASASVFLTRAGKVRITATPTFTIDWTSTDLRDALGFTGNLSGATNYTAPNLSPYFWSPGVTESPQQAPLGSTGAYVTDAVVAESASSVTVTEHNNWRENAFRFTYIDASRYHTTDEDNGEFFTFWKNVISKGFRWKLYRLIDEDTASTTEVSYNAALGPYVMMGGRRGRLKNPFARVRGLEWVDKANTLDLKCRTVSELSNS